LRLEIKKTSGEQNKMAKTNKIIKSKKKESMFERRFNTMIITISLTIFFLGFFLGWNFADTSLSELEINFGQTQLNLNSISQRFEFAQIFENDKQCNDELFSDVSQMLYESRIELDSLEKENKVETKYYQFLKEQHNINQVYFYSEYKKYYEICNTTSDIILFLFDGNSPETSSIQGAQIDKAFKSNPNIIVIPLDYGHSRNLQYFYNYYDLLLLVQYYKVYTV